MESRESVLRTILKNEYGIQSGNELKAAIERMQKVDITIFCDERIGEDNGNIINTGDERTSVQGIRPRLPA